MKLFVTVLLACLVSVSHAVVETQELTDANFHLPCTDYNPQRTAFFGDTHVHTKYSLDASTQDTRTTPAQAYQFAKGEKVGVQPFDANGNPTRFQQLSRPLDFAMVTDHAELIGEVHMCNSPGAEGYSSWQCWGYRTFPRVAFFLFNSTATRGIRLGMCGDDGELCREAGMAPWAEMIEAAEHAYDRSENCDFSSFIAYEWTGTSENVANLHRNVIFRNAEVPRLPVNFIDGMAAELLWDNLDTQCIKGGKGCDVVVIPHNSNLSDGQMFTTTRRDRLITAADASQTARFETLVEVMQHKGSSECFFGAGASEDELCAFEQLPYDKFSGKFSAWAKEAPSADDGYLREVLRDGLREQKRIGVNPFKWGFVGSTDTHLGLPGAVDEKNFLGHGGAGTPAEVGAVGLPDDLEFNPGGLAVLYAEQNTRDSLFAAMKRREAYGTSGPRIKVRFFGGWGYPANLCDSAEFVKHGYDNGVPMGGDLPARDVAAVTEAPRFAVQAMQDPGVSNDPGTPLQRIQIIKGWVDSEGQSQESVFDVVGDANNGATVDLSNCKASGKGFQNLCTVWQDPSFDAMQNAYYYARVVENPSCRWSQYICSANKVDCANPDTIVEGLEACCSIEHRPTIQERAWTSPIWYTAEP